AEQVAEHADALVLVTEWDQYQDLDWAAMAQRARTAFLLDGRHFLDMARMTRDGWKCVRISG
ncbi:MAG: UDP binding domain-containing protein, partial [Acidobacteriota bacterium]